MEEGGKEEEDELAAMPVEMYDSAKPTPENVCWGSIAQALRWGTASRGEGERRGLLKKSGEGEE